MRTIDALAAAAFLALATFPARAMDDQAIYWRVDGQVEHRFDYQAPQTEWKGTAWIGDDSNKLRLFSSGVLDDAGRIDGEGGTKGIDSRIFYSRLISDFWDAKAGVQVAVFGPGLTRTGFMAGFEGLAPYGFHVDAVGSVSQTGVLSARLDVDYDILFSQKLIATPYFEAMLASMDDPAIRLGAGLPRLEAGVRLRYEFAKEFAPYVGVSFEQFTGNTAAFVAQDGDPTSKLRAMVGLKVWF
ncbi:MAG: copper resistance protein B [Reyranellales bacterium]